MNKVTAGSSLITVASSPVSSPDQNQTTLGIVLHYTDQDRPRSAYVHNSMWSAISLVMRP